MAPDSIILKTFSTFFLIFCVNFEQIIARPSEIISLNESNWKEMLQGHWMVEFFAPWCPACKALQPVWEDFAKWSDDLHISVAQIDVTTSPGLSGRFMVTALPTIYHVLNGEFRQYKGGRDKDSFLSFIEDKKFKNLDPIPGWQSPASIQMELVARFFEVSTVLRAIHNQLHEEYGIPVIGSYIIFAIATIIIGGLLGLLLVCLIDCIFPPKMPQLAKPPVKAKTDDNASDEKHHAGSESQSDTQTESEEEEEDEEEEGEGEEEEDEDEEGENEENEENDVEGEEGEEESSQIEESDHSQKSNENIRKRKPRKAD